jgi:2TM domain-containing protein
MDSDEDYRRARRRVKSIRGFYIHLMIYVGVMILLFAINAVTPGPWWALFPLLGWGVGVAAHGAAVFGLVGFLGPDWEERKIREQMAKERER